VTWSSSSVQNAEAHQPATDGGPPLSGRSVRGTLELERGHAARLQYGPRVVVGERQDVGEHALERLGIALALLAGGSAGQRLQLADQGLQLAVVGPVLAKRGVLRRPARLQNRA